MKLGYASFLLLYTSVYPYINSAAHLIIFNRFVSKCCTKSPQTTVSIYSTKDCSQSFLYYFVTTYAIYLKPNIFVCRQLAKESNECQLGLALIDPEKFTASMIEKNPDCVTTIVLDILKTSPGFVLVAYHTGSHYFLVVICPK